MELFDIFLMLFNKKTIPSFVTSYTEIIVHSNIFEPLNQKSMIMCDLPKPLQIPPGLYG